jgi:hypothetical protein
MDWLNQVENRRMIPSKNTAMDSHNRIVKLIRYIFPQVLSLGHLEKWPFSESRVAHLPSNLFVARENFILEISAICLR